MPPTITTISPPSGLTLGDTLVTISGTGLLPPGAKTKVKFGAVYSPEVSPVSPTKILALSPPGDPGVAADVTVEITTPHPPGPPVTESATKKAAFAYGLPDLSVADAGSYPIVTRITSRLVAELRRTVVASAYHDLHPEYADIPSAVASEAKQAALPNLKLVGPRITEDRFYATRGRTPIGVDVFAEPTTVQLHYDLVGVGRTTAEVDLLWQALQAYLKATPRLKLAVGSENFEFELEEVWEQRGDFRSIASRQGIYQFSESVVVRGVNVLGDLVVGSTTPAEVISLGIFSVAPTIEGPEPSSVDPTVILDEFGEGELGETADGADSIDGIAEIALDEGFFLQAGFGVSSPSPLDFGVLRPGDVVILGKIVVDVAFDDPAAVLSLGLKSAPDGMLSTADVDATKPGTYANNTTYIVSVIDAIRLKISPGASAKGSGRVIVFVRRG